MKKITILFFAMITISLNAQTTLFQDDFESYTDFIIDGIGDWITLDFDGLGTYSGGVDGATYPNVFSPMAFQIFNPSTTTPTPATNESDPGAGEVRNFDPFDGDKYAGAWASVPAAPGDGNDDWLISPVISLAASDNTLTFQAKALSNTYGDENYEVGVYVGSGTPTGGGDFTIIGGTRTATYPNWEEVTIDLSAYDGMDVRIGIHYISSDVYMLMIDAFSVETLLSVSEFELNTFSHAYNKDTSILNLESSNLPLTGIEIYNVLGKSVIKKSLASTTEEIRLSEIADGVYLAIVTIDGGTKTFKFIKQ